MLASLDDLKARLNIDADDTAEDARLTQALADAVGLMESFCVRRFTWESAITETLDGGGSTLYLARFPIVAITSVKVSLAYNFAAATALVAGTDYLLVADRGRLHRLPQGLPWDCGTRVVQVVYSAGYADPDADPPPVGPTVPPSHIQEACLIQAAECYARRAKPGEVPGNAGGNGVAFGGMRPAQLVPLAKQLLQEERRYT